MSHTPGPWLIEDDSEGFVWVASENPPPREQYWTTAKCCGPNARANAHLIAAAPDLLAQLKIAYDTLRELSEHSAFADDASEFNQGGIGYETMDTIRAAIAKAEGRS